MDEEEVTGHRCTICSKLYRSEHEATRCHGNSEPIEAFTCGRCGTIYDDREKAKKCCSPL
jgi:hypothetical protein